jgi:hypothetical protein
MTSPEICKIVKNSSSWGRKLARDRYVGNIISLVLRPNAALNLDEIQ